MEHSGDLRDAFTVVLISGHLMFQNNNNVNAHSGGVAIMVHRDIKHRVSKTCAISEMVIYITVKLNDHYSLQVIQAYAPTSTAENEEAEQFYEDITTARNAEKARFVVVMGDFNAKVGRREKTDPGNVGPYGLGSRNERGQMLVDYMSTEGLFCMNTHFKKPPQKNMDMDMEKPEQQGEKRNRLHPHQQQTDLHGCQCPQQI